MRACELYLDEWQGSRDLGTPKLAPGWPDIEAAFQQLDQRKHTQLVMTLGGGHSIVVGGGGGRYSVFVTHDIGTSTLINKGSAGETEMLVAGGQRGSYPAQQVVDAVAALRALRHFFESGTTDKELSWENEAGD